MYNINSKIKQILEQYGISYNDGVSYLLSVYYKVSPSYIPDSLKKKVLASNIFILDKDGNATWKIPLFDEQMTNFEWVHEYRETFKRANPDRAGSLKYCITRFKRFFAENPNVRLEEVKGAVKMYFASIKNPEYVMTSHYFIYKDKGVNETSELQVWLERYRESISVERKSNSNKMQ